MHQQIHAHTQSRIGGAFGVKIAAASHLAGNGFQQFQLLAARTGVGTRRKKSTAIQFGVQSGKIATDPSLKQRLCLTGSYRGGTNFHKRHSTNLSAQNTEFLLLISAFSLEISRFLTDVFHEWGK
jgi:hypothetical protein